MRARRQLWQLIFVSLNRSILVQRHDPIKFFKNPDGVVASRSRMWEQQMIHSMRNYLFKTKTTIAVTLVNHDEEQRALYTVVDGQSATAPLRPTEAWADPREAPEDTQALTIFGKKTTNAYPELVEYICGKEEQLHPSKALAGTLTLSQREGNQLVDFLELPVLLKESLGFETLRFEKHLELAPNDKAWSHAWSSIHYINVKLELNFPNMKRQSKNYLKIPETSNFLKGKNFASGEPSLYLNTVSIGPGLVHRTEQKAEFSSLCFTELACSVGFFDVYWTMFWSIWFELKIKFS